MNKNEKGVILQEMNLQEMVDVNGGIAPLILALAWGFGIGFPSGIAIGIAMN